MLVLLSTMLVACQNEAESTTSGSEPTIAEQMFTDTSELNYNPLTGEELPSGADAGRRPVAIMVNNSQVALPQRGVAAADAVLEMATEGGITRLMAFYSDIDDIPQVGSVRSARDQHLQFAMPLNAIVVHIGTSIYASNLLNTYTYASIDGRYLGTTSFWFDELRATSRAEEHCWYTDSQLIKAGVDAANLETHGKSYPLVNFRDYDASFRLPDDGDAPHIEFKFSELNITEFLYNEESNTYLKSVFGAPHADEESDQLAYENVLILFSQVGLKDDGYCSDFDLISGTGYYMFGGKYQEIQWEKGDAEEPLIIKGTNGNDYDINPGKTYIGVTSYDYQGSVVMDKSGVLT